MSFGLFESSVTSELETGLAKQAAVDKLAAAVYDVREQLGPFLFQAASLEEFRDRVAMTKNDQSVYKIIEAHLTPVTGVVRRIVGKNGELEKEFKAILATGLTAGKQDYLKNQGWQTSDADDDSSPTQHLPPTSDAGKKKKAEGRVAAPGDPGDLHDLDQTPMSGTNRDWVDAFEQNGHPMSGLDKGLQGIVSRRADNKKGRVATDYNNLDANGVDWDQAGANNPGAAPVKPTISGINGDPTKWGNRRRADGQSTPGDLHDLDQTPMSGTNRDWVNAFEQNGHPMSGIDKGLQGLVGRRRQGTDYLDSNGENPEQGAIGPAPAGALDMNWMGHESGRRSADFDGEMDNDTTFRPSDAELVPEGNFEGYLNKVDQNGDKVQDRNFTSSVDFAIYADWCEANRCHPMRLASLDAYAANLSDLQYLRLARAIQAWEFSHQPKAPKGQSKTKLKDVTAGGRGYPSTKGTPWEDTDRSGLPKTKGTPWEDTTRSGYPKDKHEAPTNAFGGSWSEHSSRRDPLQRYIAWCKHNGYKRLSARNVEIYSRGNPQLCSHLALRMKNAIHVARVRQAGGEGGGGLEFDEHGNPPGLGPERLNEMRQNISDWNQTARRRQAGDDDGDDDSDPNDGFGGKKAPPFGSKDSRRRYAQPDYLQKADDALTQLLNQKAEEFQQTIAPLQQALVTVQQAEQLQQANNPMNVLPPPGTVNVMPGGDQGPAGMPDPNAQDLGAAAQALAGGGDPSGGAPPGAAGLGAAPSGGTPDDQGGPPPAAAGGGLPPELDPTAQQQVQARRRRAGAWADPEEYDYGPFASGPLSGRGKPPAGRADTPEEMRHLMDWREKDDEPERHARRGGGRPKGRGAARSRDLTAAGVMDLWKKFQQQQGQSGNIGLGGDYDYEQFQQQYGIGDQALNKLKTHHQTGVTMEGRRRGKVRGAAEAPNIAEEAVKGQWRQMDSAMTAHGYKFDKGSNHWTKPGHLPIKNHWQHTGGQHSDWWDPTSDGGAGLGLHAIPELEQNFDPDPGANPPPKMKTRKGPPTYPHPQHSAEEPVFGRQAGQHDYDPENVEQEFAPARGHGWEHDSGPSGRPYVRPQNGPGRHEGGLYDHFRDWPNDKLKGFHQHLSTTPWGDSEDKHTISALEAEMTRRSQGLSAYASRTGRHKQAWSGWGPALFPQTRQVTGWNWDDYLNGYIANRPQHFACNCGESFPTPSGFHRCACGQQWNSYVIGTGGNNKEAAAEKFLVREIPVRPDVIVANREMTGLRKEAPFADYQDFDDCTSQNSDKRDPSAYCGEIKHRTEDKKARRKRAKAPTALNDRWTQTPNGWEHPDGGVVRPSTEAQGKYQLWGPTVTMGDRGGKLAPLKQPHEDPHHLMDWYSWASGEGPKPKGTSFFGAVDPDWTPPADWDKKYRAEGLERQRAHEQPGYQPYSWDDFDADMDAQGIKGRPKHGALTLIDPRTGGMHTLIDPGELGEGEDPGTPGMKTPPPDWARRGDGAKWQKSPIGS